MNILIVDDSVFARSLIIRSLSICGLGDAVFKEAANGEEALAVLKSNDIDLVFTDLNMPDMDGEELLKRIKSDSSYMDLPVVVITSIKNPAKEEKLMANNAAAVLEKPLPLMDLHEVITKNIGMQKGVRHEV
jgi:two-component system chemotaxis response regulator CheY